MRAVAVCAVVVIALAVAGCGGGGSGSGTATPEATGGAADGKTLFAANGCSGCHTLSKAGANGTTGPNLDKQLQADAKAAGKPVREFVRQSIVEPDAFVAKGYSSGVMPKDFGDKLSSEQLKTLVDYVSSAGH
jgi:mono/diheme cytochrome c family protein